MTAILSLLSAGISHIALPPPAQEMASEQSCLLVLYSPGSTHKIFHARELKPRTQRQHLRPKRSQIEQERQISVASKAAQPSTLMSSGSQHALSLFYSSHFGWNWPPPASFPDPGLLAGVNSLLGLLVAKITTSVPPALPCILCLRCE